MINPDNHEDDNPRKAGAFKINDDQKSKPANDGDFGARAPLAVTDPTLFSHDENDVFENLSIDEQDLDLSVESAIRESKGWLSLSNIFWTSLGLLISFAIGIWTQDLINALFDRSTWLGWLGLVAAIIGLIALILMVSREFIAIRRLSSVADLQKSAHIAFKNDDAHQARSSIEQLAKVTENIASTSRGRQIISDTKDDIIDGKHLIALAEREVLSPLDAQARMLILSSAKRVSVVTAISPRALVDVVFVIYESAKLIRRIAELYGARPGWFGFIKLSRKVLAHLAVTGTIAMGDSLIQQLVGQGLASRLSAKLGEGIINGLMTARIGLSALDVVRPFPFQAEKRPNISDIIAELTKLGRNKA